MTEVATRRPARTEDHPVADEALQSWREVESRLRPFVARRVATPADVDDVLQEVFLRLQRGLSSLREDERLAPWLFAIARNVVTDHHRRAARHPLVGGDVGEALLTETLLAETPLGETVAEPTHEGSRSGDRLEHELTACVAQFVTMLPDEQREAITLVELEGMSQKDAAAMLGISHSGMKSRVQRGRIELRRMFERACAIELDARRKVIDCEPRACGACGPDAGERD